MRWLIVFAVGCSSTSQHVPSATGDERPAGHEVMLVGGDILTMDPQHPHATSVVWDAQGRITGVDADPKQHPNARLIDLHGHSVTPGLIDAHCHLYELGTDLESVSVRGAANEHDAAALLATATGADGWLHGQGWDQNKWPGQQFPTKASLDAVVGDRPALVERVDGHASWVSSKALALAGITATTPDPEGGKIVRDAKGEATGVLVDNAQALVFSKVPVATPALRAKRILAGAKLAIAKGITGIHEMGIADETAAVYRGLAEHQELPLRVYAFLRGDPDHPEALATRHPAPAMGRFQMRGVKFFVDGALGSRGARLKAPYADDPKNQGLWVTPPDKLTAAVKAAASGGWDIAVHAIGDAGVHAVLEAFAASQPSSVNLRVEHTQVIAPDDVDLMVKVHAIASMQPTHATSDMPWAEARLGKDRILGAYAWRTMLDHHIPLIGGSDFPVEEVGPLLGIYAAVTRQDAAGNPPGGWYPAQRMTFDEAIAAFTRDAAAAEHITDRGVIEVGNHADFTVYADKLTPDRSLLTMAIAMTVVDGDVVYERGAR